MIDISHHEACGDCRKVYPFVNQPTDTFEDHFASCPCGGMLFIMDASATMAALGESLGHGEIREVKIPEDYRWPPV